MRCLAKVVGAMSAKVHAAEGEGEDEGADEGAMLEFETAEELHERL